MPPEFVVSYDLIVGVIEEFKVVCDSRTCGSPGFIAKSKTQQPSIREQAYVASSNTKTGCAPIIMHPNISILDCA